MRIFRTGNSFPSIIISIKLFPIINRLIRFSLLDELSAAKVWLRFFCRACACVCVFKCERWTSIALVKNLHQIESYENETKMAKKKQKVFNGPGTHLSFSQRQLTGSGDTIFPCFFFIVTIYFGSCTTISIFSSPKVTKWTIIGTSLNAHVHAK